MLGVDCCAKLIFLNAKSEEATLTLKFKSKRVRISDLFETFLDEKFSFPTTEQ